MLKPIPDKLAMHALVPRGATHGFASAAPAAILVPMPTLEINATQPWLISQPDNVAEVEERLSVVEELVAVVSANLQRATRLRQSILKKPSPEDF